MTGQAVSDLLSVTPQWIAKLEKEGFVERLDNKRFDVIDVCLGYIRWLKDPARRTTKTEGAKRTETLKNEMLELDLAERKHKLGDLETFELTAIEIFTTLRTEIDAVPAGTTRDLALRAKMEALLNGAFERCRHKLENTVADLRSGAPVLDTAEEGDT